MPVVKGYEVDITHENPAIPIDVIEDVVARLSHPETVMVENRADIFDSHLRVTCRVIAPDNLPLHAVAVGTHGIRTRGALTADEGNGQEEEPARLEELLLGQGVCYLHVEGVAPTIIS